MPVELTPEDQAAAEAWVEAGRFQSVDEGVHVSMQNMRDQQEWNDYAGDRIEAGLADIAAGCTRSAEDVLAMLVTYQQNRPDDRLLYRNGGRVSPRSPGLLPGTKCNG